MGMTDEVSARRRPDELLGPNVRCVGEMLFAARRVVRTGDRCVFECEAIASPAAAYYMEIATGRRAPGTVSS
jgi:hypothetical protein